MPTSLQYDADAYTDRLDPGMLMPASIRKVPVRVDLVFLVDRSGSSDAFAQGIRRAIPMIAQPVIKKAAQVRLFLQTHSDLDYGERPVMIVRDGSLAELQAAADSLVFEGGGDPPEHHAHALETALESVDWIGTPPKSRGAIVMFTTSDTKASPSGRSLQQIGTAVRDRQLMLFAVSQMVPGMRTLIEAAQPFGQAVVESIFPISNDPSAVEMEGIAGRVAKSVTGSLTTGLVAQ